ncbi:hypothetical protein EYS10_25075 [Rahnella aquatilis]|nr:hypothetical protein EYS10_25075 [Rahnella aquatilis]
MMSMNPFYTSHRIGQLILKRSALAPAPLFLLYPSIRPGYLFCYFARALSDTPVTISIPVIYFVRMLNIRFIE